MLASFSPLRSLVCCAILVMCSLSASAQLQTLTVTTTQNMGSFSDVWMVDANIGYAAGRLAIYKTTNGGATWTLLPAFNPTSGPFGMGDFDYAYMYEQHLYFTDANHGISAAWNGFYQAEEIIVTNDGGATWTVKHKVNPNTAPFQPIEQRLRFLDRLASGNFITGGYRGRILLSIDGGNTWTVSTTNTTANLEDISFIDASNGFAAGDGVVLKTANGGSTWTKLETTYEINNIKALSATNLIATTNNNHIIRSTDGGQSWVDVIQSTEFFTDIEFIDNQIGFFLTENGLYKTTNAGASFQYVQLLSTSPGASEMQALSENKFYIATTTGKILFNNNTDLPFESVNGFYGDSQSFCQNTSVTFHNVGSPAYSYKWYVDEVEAAQTYDFTYTFPDVSPFHSVKLVSDNGTQPRTITQFFNVRPQPIKPPVATILNEIPDTVEINAFASTMNIEPKTPGNYYQLFRNGVAQSDRQQYLNSVFPYMPVTTLTETGEYNYVLRAEAVNDCNVATTDTKFTIIVIDKPLRIKQIDINNVANGQVKLHWMQDSQLPTHYIVQRRLEGTNTWTQIASIPFEWKGDGETFIDNTIVPGKAYSYRVAAANDNGRSGFSDIKTINAYDKVIYVNGAATGKNNGLTWTDAFKVLSDALPHSEEDLEIWVAKGTYKHDLPTTWTVSAGGLYGGFAGGETDRDQRNPKVNKTVIDSEDIWATIQVEENSVLDGVSITNYYAGPTSYGFIANCRIEYCMYPLTMMGDGELATSIIRNNYQGMSRYGHSKIFNSVIYNNGYSDIVTYYLQEDGVTWMAPYDPYSYKIPDLYYSVVPGVLYSMGQNTITNTMFNDKDVDGPGRPEKELRIMDYLSGDDGMVGTDDDIYHWPYPELIDKGVMNDPLVYSQSKGFSKDLEGNPRIFNGTPDLGPIEYGPDPFPLPEAPTVVYNDNKSVEIQWIVPTDQSITKIWITMKDKDGNDAAMWRVDRTDGKKNIGAFPPNMGYTFELRYGRSLIVSRPGPSSPFTIPKKPGDFVINDIVTTMRPDNINVPLATEDGRRFSYEIADPSIAEWVPDRFEFKLKKIGTTTFTATTPENNLYFAASLTRTLTVGKGNQTLPFYNNGNLVINNESERTKSFVATTSAGLTVVYTSSNTNVATVNGNAITFLSSGTVTITAAEPGNENYNPVSTSFTLNVTVPAKSNQVLTGVTNLNKLIGDADFTPPITTNSGLALAFSSNDPSIASVIGTKIHIIKTGVVTITVSQPGNFSWNSVNASFNLTISAGSHSLILVSQTQYDYRYGMDPFALSPVTTAGMPATYTSSDPSILSINNFTATVKKPGNVTIFAHASAAQSYPELSASVTLTIKKGIETIDFKAISDSKVGTSILLNARALKQNQDAVIGLSSTKGQLTGKTLMLVTAGKLSVTASYVATENYEEPTPVTQTICILPEPPVITPAGAQLTSSSDDNKWFFNETPMSETGKTITATASGSYTAVAVVETCMSEPSESVDFVSPLDPVTGLGDIEQLAIQLYPNPVSETLYIEGLEPNDKLRVLDGMGKQVLSATSTSKTIELNMRDFAQGFYYVVVDSKNVVLKFVR